MRTTSTTLQTPDGPMECFEAIPDDPRGAIVVIQEAFGVNDHIRDVTTRFANEGYRAIAPALYHRAGGGTAPYDDFSKVMPLMQGVSDETFLMDVDAVLAHLREAGIAPQSTGIVGFCMGGRVTFLVALRRALGAAVGFYGGGIVTQRRPQTPSLVEDAVHLQTPWLGLFGDEDQSIPVEDVEKLRAALEADAKPDTEIVRYPGAQHGFFCDKRPSYDAEAAADAWPRTLRWFGEYLRT
jgi:carboxymethylenebutenolidase